MNDSPEMPDIEYKAGAVVSQMGGDLQPSWVVESPAEIREKLKALKDSHGMGLEDEEMLLTLTGLDIYTDKEPLIEPYDLSMHPGSVLQIKEVTERFWVAHTESAAQRAQQQQGPPEGMPPAVAQALGGLGVDLSQIQPWPGPLGEHPESKPMTLEEFSEGGAEIKCCCGHQAKVHEVGDQTMGACTDCGCVRFHVHLSEKADADQAQD